MERKGTNKHLLSINYVQGTGLNTSINSSFGIQIYLELIFTAYNDGERTAVGCEDPSSNAVCH